VAYRSTSPVLGLQFRASQQLSLYASAGRGFETPTFNELSYRASGATGLNFELKPAVSDSVEAGVKWRANGVRAQVAVFHTQTNNEIATLTNSGGRSSFQNVGKSERKGLEAALTAQLPAELSLTLSGTYLAARYLNDFKTCGAPPCTTPNVAVAAGNKLPGIPQLAGFAELAWRPVPGLMFAVDAKHQGKVYVNDTNTDAAAAYTLLNARLVYDFILGTGNKFSAFVRGDNLSNTVYAGSVIVNEGNGRFFEPGAPRRVSVGLGFSKSI
jgi:iron complex outermembrane receptor protein